MAVPYAFANATTTQNLSYLDANFNYFGNAITVQATSTAMTIDSSGNVGIGTTSPVSKLDVNGQITARSTLNVYSSGVSNLLIRYANSINRIDSYNDPITATTPLQFDASQYTFLIADAEKMRIDSSGNLLVATTSTTSAGITFPTLVVNSSPFSKGSSSGFFWENRSSAATATTNWYGWYTTSGTAYFWNGGGNVASINPSTGVYTPLSDGNKKKDFEPSAVGLDAILQLKPTLYRMKDADENSPKELGFIAQEVKDYIPQAYVEYTSLDAANNESTYIGLNDRPIVAVLVKALQEAVAKIDALETRIATLETK